MLSIYDSRLERAVSVLRESWLKQYNIMDNGEDNWEDMEPDVRNDAIECASDHCEASCRMRVSEVMWDEDAMDVLWSSDLTDEFYKGIFSRNAYYADQMFFEAVWYEHFEEEVHKWLMDNFEFDREPIIVG